MDKKRFKADMVHLADEAEEGGCVAAGDGLMAPLARLDEQTFVRMMDAIDPKIRKIAASAGELFVDSVVGLPNNDLRVAMLVLMMSSTLVRFESVLAETLLHNGIYSVTPLHGGESLRLTGDLVRVRRMVQAAFDVSVGAARGCETIDAGEARGSRVRETFRTKGGQA